MSRLTDILRQVRKGDEQLGSDLEAEVAALLKRRTFGLVFERHQPEAVELPGRVVRLGDKVRILPPRGEIKTGDQRLWRVDRIERANGARVGYLTEIGAEDAEVQSVPVDDLVIVAEFKDRILPGLVETERVERGGLDKPFHTVINAENYHALEMLTYTHRQSIDAIYIDPPYNTGAKDWKYNNNYVEGDDDYRHSKWLAFMERRLQIARDLLNPMDSVLIITIDEKEYLRLGLLLEQTFPEARIQMVSTLINPASMPRQNMFGRSDEYLFFVFVGAASPTRMALSSEWVSTKGRTFTGEIRWDLVMQSGPGSQRRDSPNGFYPVYIDPNGPKVARVGDPLPLAEPPGDSETGELVALWPIRKNGSEGRWRLAAPTLRQRLERGEVRVGGNSSRGFTLYYLPPAELRKIESGAYKVEGRRPDGSPITSKALKGPTSVPTTQWRITSHDATQYGSRLISAMMPDRKFPFPKSLYAVEDALRFLVRGKPEAVILDFFAGSGTTAHAVMRLNKQDSGRRQCISVTNNEVSADEQKTLRKQGFRPGDPEWETLGICDYITKPRVTDAITGMTPEGDPIRGDYKFTDEFPMSEGFEENAVFFTLTYEAPLSVRHHRAFERIAPMLWLRAGSRGRMIDDLRELGWDVAEAYGVLEDIDQMGAFVARVAEVQTVKTVFVVTDSDAAFQATCRDLPQRVTAVRLYESYLDNFQINRRAGA